MDPRVFRSGMVSFGAPDRDQRGHQLPARPPLPQSRQQQYQSVQAIEALNKSIQQLHLSINYRSIQANKPAKPSKEQVLADALTYIRWLALGRLVHGARSLPTDQNVKMLINLIPTHGFVAAGVPSSSSHLITTGGFTPSHRQILDAASAYIVELMAKKTISHLQKSHADHQKVFGSGLPTLSEQTKDVALTHNEGRQVSDTAQDVAAAETGSETETETPTERALRKMDQWCDLWLNGDLKGDDWETFNDCLDLPD